MQPRLVTEKAAAAAVGVEVSVFRHLVASGRLPKELPEVGLFDLKAIDAALDRLSGIGSPSDLLDGWLEKQRESGS